MRAVHIWNPDFCETMNKDTVQLSLKIKRGGTDQCHYKDVDYFCSEEADLQTEQLAEMFNRCFAACDARISGTILGFAPELVDDYIRIHGFDRTNKINIEFLEWCEKFVGEYK